MNIELSDEEVTQLLFLLWVVGKDAERDHHESMVNNVEYLGRKISNQLDAIRKGKGKEKKYA